MEAYKSYLVNQIKLLVQGLTLTNMIAIGQMTNGVNKMLKMV